MKFYSSFDLYKIVLKMDENNKSMKYKEKINR